MRKEHWIFSAKPQETNESFSLQTEKVKAQTPGVIFEIWQGVKRASPCPGLLLTKVVAAYPWMSESVRGRPDLGWIGARFACCIHVVTTWRISGSPEQNGAALGAWKGWQTSTRAVPLGRRWSQFLTDQKHAAGEGLGALLFQSSARTSLFISVHLAEIESAKWGSCFFLSVPSTRHNAFQNTQSFHLPVWSLHIHWCRDFCLWRKKEIF